MLFKKFQKYIKILMLTLPMILLFAVPSALVYASSATMDFVVEDDFVIVGNRFIVEVRVAADQIIGKVNLNVVFDDSKIAFATGPECVTQEGNILTIKDEGAGASNGEKVYVLYFDAVSAGSAYLKTAAPPEVYSTEGEEMTVAVKTSSIAVRENDILSDDNSLSGLVIKDTNGKSLVLTPSFHADILEYSAQVENDISKVLVTANPGDSNANIAVDGASVLQVGSNDIKITVTAEDGSRRIYTIHVERQDSKETTPEPTAVVANPTPIVVEKEPEKGITAEFKGYGTFLTEYHTYVLATSLNGLKVPDDYEETTVFIGQDTVKVYAKKGQDPEHVLIALSDEKGNVAFYRYDRKEETLQKLWDEDITYKEVNLNYDAEIMLALKKSENKAILLAIAAAVAAALAVVLFIMNIVKKFRIRGLEDELSSAYKPTKSKSSKTRSTKDRK